jgi:hypothetical protein
MKEKLMMLKVERLGLSELVQLSKKKGPMARLARQSLAELLQSPDPELQAMARKALEAQSA